MGFKLGDEELGTGDGGAPRQWCQGFPDTRAGLTSPRVFTIGVIAIGGESINAQGNVSAECGTGRDVSAGP